MTRSAYALALICGAGAVLAAFAIGLMIRF